MGEARHKLQIILLVVISLTILAAPARGGDWFGIQLGTGGFSLSFGSSNWAVYGSSWSDPGWQIDYHVALAGYGDWVWVDGLGQCWRPWVAPGWGPYTHGRWVWTRLGWTWVAYEPWGYFPHHYGDWALSSYGWVWTPGYVYRPANVIWVEAGGFVGWYARPPSGWSHARRGWHSGHFHGYATGYNDGYTAGWQDAQHATYTQWRHFGADDLSRHAVPYSATRGSGSHKAIRSGIAAPDRGDLGRRGITTPRMDVESRTVRVGDRQMTVTRPTAAQSEIRRHAEPTVQRALTRDAQNTAISRERAERSAPVAGSRGVAPSRSSVDSAGDRRRTVRPSPGRAAPSADASGGSGRRQPVEISQPTTSTVLRRGNRAGGPPSTGSSTTRSRPDRSAAESSTAPASRSRVRPEATREELSASVRNPSKPSSTQQRRSAGPQERGAQESNGRQENRVEERKSRTQRPQKGGERRSARRDTSRKTAVKHR